MNKLLLLSFLILNSIVIISCSTNENEDSNGNGNYNCDDKWHIYTVDSDADAGLFTSIDVDSDDNPHISYFSYELKYSKDDGDIEEYTYYLKYAKNTQNGWEVSKISKFEEWIEEGSVALVNTDIDVDSKGNAHIVYSHHDRISGLGILYYATNSSGSWQILKLGNGGIASIAVDSKDGVHIAFNSMTGPGGLQYITNASGKWELHILDYIYVSFPSIAIDSLDKVHISYSGRDLEEKHISLKYITNVSGEWEKTKVREEVVGSIISKIAVDSKDKVHLAYCHEYPYEYVSDELFYVTNSSGEWSILALDSGDITRGWTSDFEVTVGSDNSVHIVYDWRDGLLKYISNQTGSWQSSIISSSNKGWSYWDYYPSIATDSKGCVHMSFYNVATDELMYATNRAP